MDLERLGILGGTFDPIHYGHLVMGQEAYVRLHLEKVLYMPAGQPPHKMNRHISDVEDRVHMVELAIGDNNAFELSRIDIERPGPSYTADLLEVMHEIYPRAELYFIVGMDSLEEILTWKDPNRILNLAHIVALPRPGYPKVNLAELLPELPKAEERIEIYDMPQLSISSTALQQRVAQGLPIRYLVPPPVEGYIYSHKLYQKREPK